MWAGIKQPTYHGALAGIHNGVNLVALPGLIEQETMANTTPGTLINIDFVIV